MLETLRLLIRPYTLEDAELVFQLMNTPGFHEMVGDRGVSSIEIAKEYTKNRFIAQYERLGYSNNVMILKTTGEKVGSVGLHNREGIEGADLGYSMLPQFEGQGFVQEGGKRLMQHAFEDLKMEKLSAITTQKNLASNHILKKLGFQYQGEIQIPKVEEWLSLYETYSDFR